MSNFIIALIVPIVLGLLFSAAGRAKPIETEDGGYILHYAKAIKGFAIGFALLVLGGLIFLLFQAPIEDLEDMYAILFLFSFFGIFIVYFYIEFFTVKIWVGPKGIRGTSGWRGKRKYTWSEISKITYSPISMWFKVSSPNKPPLRVHAMITGIDKLQEEFIKNMPEEKWQSAYESFNKDKRVNK